MSYSIIDTIKDETEETLPPGESLHDLDHEIWLSQQAARLGFPVAGFIKEIYEGAFILIPPFFRFDWSKRKIKIGRVIEAGHNDYDVRNFVLLMEDGTQVPCTMGGTHPCFFALPETI